MSPQQYLYVDAQGQPLYRVLRINNKDGSKTFIQQRRTATGWATGLDGVPYVLYHLPHVMESDEVWLVEGEKCADVLMAGNITATTKSGGAQRGWTEGEIKALAGKHVIICPDYDEPGHNMAWDAVAALHGVTASTRLLSLTGLELKQDVYDWLEKPNASHETLLELAKGAPKVTPANDPRPKKPERKVEIEPDRPRVDSGVTREDIRACLDLITVHSRDEAVAVMLSIKHAGGSVDDFLEWRCRQPVGNGNFDRAKGRMQWKTAKPQGGANFGKLVALAKEADPGFVTPSFLVELEHKAMEGMLGEADVPPWEEAERTSPKPNKHLNGHAKAKAYVPPAAAPSLEELFDPWREIYAPKFPLDVLPHDIRNFVVAKSTEVGVCLSAVAASCLTAISGAITHEAKLFLKPGKNYPVSPRLWTMLVGDPSTKKTPAISGAIRPILSHQKKQHGGAMAVYKEALDAAAKKKDVEQPKLIHYVLSDITPEALGDILSKQDRGTLIHADELAGWIAGMDRYSNSGKGGSGAGRSVWLQAYNGGHHSVHRISRPATSVNNLSVSILGGIQPDRVRELGNLTSDGLLQRFLPVMMRRSRLDSDKFDLGAWKPWADRIEGLLDIGAFKVSLSHDATTERNRMAAELQEMGGDEGLGSGYQSFIGKLMGIWGSLALIMHCIWETRVAGDVSLDNAVRASRLLEEFFIPHARAFYETIAGSSQADARAIGTFIAKWPEKVAEEAQKRGETVDLSKPVSIEVRNLATGPACCRGKQPDEVVKKVGPFETGGWLTPEKPGPWNRKWYITPGLAQRFANDVAAHNAMVAKIRAKFGKSDNDE